LSLTASVASGRSVGVLSSRSKAGNDGTVTLLISTS
jgi:hypothetical protein